MTIELLVALAGGIAGAAVVLAVVWAAVRLRRRSMWRGMRALALQRLAEGFSFEDRSV